MSDPSKFGAFFHRTYIKVPRLDIYRSMISLSGITHQMWHDHSFSQRNKTSKIAVEVEVGGNGEEGLEKGFKKVGWFWRSLFLVKSQARSLLLCKKWAQSQVFLKNFSWSFQNIFFAEYISVAASWNYIIVSQRYSKTLMYIWTCFYYVRYKKSGENKLWHSYDIRNKT